MSDRDEVLGAAADLVSAFARNDREAYFGAFSADASFVFYTLPQPLLNRAWAWGRASLNCALMSPSLGLGTITSKSCCRRSIMRGVIRLKARTVFFIAELHNMWELACLLPQ